ncbi:MAG: hypothetical protein HY057_13370 [Rhodospirillales bacterium]|nr:hypothetical protein [Rhodospirillales bacterium]
MLSIVIASRLGGNPNSRLKRLLASAVDTCNDPARCEFLIKLDNDDPGHEALRRSIAPFAEKFVIRTLVSPRGRGYLDLHKAYNDLFFMANEAAQLFWVLADDCVFIRKDWDALLLRIAAETPIPAFCINEHLADFAACNAQQAIDGHMENFPIFSRAWLNVLGGFGQNSFTDASTAIIQHLLVRNHNIDLRIPLPAKLIERRMWAADCAGSSRWSDERAANHRALLTPAHMEMLACQARNLWLQTAHHVGATAEIAAPP